jgi:phenylalanyl-tRNA synthetase alpha subunit
MCGLLVPCASPTAAGPASVWYGWYMVAADVIVHAATDHNRYGYYWKTSEAEKNLLRTHTTAVSSRMLYRLAQTQKDGFKPAKYFSIDRVFRNEAIDRTHLAEFHQIEGGYLTCSGFLPARIIQSHTTDCLAALSLASRERWR